MFCVHPRIYKNEVVLVGVAHITIEEHIEKVTENLSGIAKKPVSTSLMKYATS